MCDRDGSARAGGVFSWMRDRRGLETGMDMLDVRERLRSRVVVMMGERGTRRNGRIARVDVHKST